MIHAHMHIPPGTFSNMSVLFVLGNVKLETAAEFLGPVVTGHWENTWKLLQRRRISGAVVRWAEVDRGFAENFNFEKVH